jgi:dTDP-4-dehydrorhamnose 3,5-epimerase
VNVTEASLPGVLVIEPRVHGDDRGFFVETFQAERFARQTGVTMPFVQDNHSRSRHRVLRGLHAQRHSPQGKLVRAARGEIFDVAADIDPASSTFRQWVGVTLSDSNHKQLWIPPGYAHGFLVLSDLADVEYKCTDYYHPNDEIGVVWNDPDIGIEWPLDNPTLSAKDLALPTLRDRRSRT